jgi:hypothetical protein
MDLFCPHCTRRVTVPDEKAGQVASCPLCAKQFMAPSLAPAPVAPKPSAPPPVSSAPAETYGMDPAPAPPPSTPGPSIAAPSKPMPAPAPPSPPVPPGEYTRSCGFCLRETWLAFVPPACVLLIFVLSFFPWHYHDLRNAFSLWTLSFNSEHGHAQFIAYTILMLLCLVLSMVAMLFDKGWLYTPPQCAAILTFKNLLVGLFLGVAFLLLCFDCLHAYSGEPANPITLAMAFAFRLHFIAIVASFLMFWLHWRKRSNLPLPRCEARF